ncbi:FAD-dependent oxidoreductase [Ligilactobacillus cholophilus]|uniref:FAD-dependent oxidoreductase n=1 Tax=Ligilactobacillus cholophilus TaxID=3050131 RepID=UPI0025AF33A8|nr:FAD-dependent oxidoreductase [Ligilactobacillus cholophilus]
MKISIIGATHAGTFAAMEILKNHPDYEVTVFEKNDNLSFLSCGIALWVGDHIADPNKMFYSNPTELAKIGAKMRMQHEVLSVDPKAKTLEVKDLISGNEFVQEYDKLIITTGSRPVIPPIEGIDGPNVYLCKDYSDAKVLKEKFAGIDKAVIIGAGYIGAELSEQAAVNNKDVTLVDAFPRVLYKNFDKELTDKIEAEYRDHDVTLALGEKVQAFEQAGDQVIVRTDKGAYEADMAVWCAGFRPFTDLFEGKLEMLPNKAIKTNEYMQTSDPDIFAAGDATNVHYNPTGKDDYIPLATNAIHQGILIGKNIDKPTVKYMGTQATSAVELFETCMAASGLTVEGAKQRGMDVDAVTIEENYRPEFMVSTTPVACRLVWDPQTHRILGGAVYSKHDVSQSANVLSLAIQNKMTIEDLAGVDMFFQPNFDQPLNWLNKVAMAACEKANQ